MQLERDSWRAHKYPQLITRMGIQDSVNGVVNERKEKGEQPKAGQRK
jgi:hypothetical protein